MFGKNSIVHQDKDDCAGCDSTACKKHMLEEYQWQKTKEVPGLALTTSPRYTTILTRRVQRESNPWCQSEAAEDFALGHRYPCRCGQDETLPGMAIGANHATNMTGKMVRLGDSWGQTGEQEE